MTQRRGQDFSIDEALGDVGFTPRMGDVPALLDRITSEDRDLRKSATAALIRVQGDVDAELVKRIESATGRELARLLRAAATVGQGEGDHGPLVAAIETAVSDDDPHARKAAASAIGRLRAPGAEVLLHGALERERRDGGEEHVVVAIIEALGKVGTARSLGTLASIDGALDASPKVRRARLMVERSSQRDRPSTIAIEGRLKSPLPIVLRCRTGLEPIVAGELPTASRPRFRPLSGKIDAVLTGPLSTPYRSRTFVDLAFALGSFEVSARGQAATVTEAITSPRARQIFETFTSGPIRFRLSWHGTGKRRGETWSLAEDIRERAPWLQNDPSGSVWEVSVKQDGDRSVGIELVPRVDDQRFAYRTQDVPAASHPTVAAALVAIAGRTEGDVVWDPFVGSGLELCERAVAGGYGTLIGSDQDPRALTAARANLDALEAKATLLLGDARSLDVIAAEPAARHGLDLIVTNPPMGQRSSAGEDVEEILSLVLERAGELLRKGGRLVWISPRPEVTRSRAPKTLTMTRTLTIDMGGFRAEIQRFDKR